MEENFDWMDATKVIRLKFLNGSRGKQEAGIFRFYTLFSPRGRAYFRVKEGHSLSERIRHARLDPNRITRHIVGHLLRPDYWVRPTSKADVLDWLFWHLREAQFLIGRA